MVVQYLSGVVQGDAGCQVNNIIPLPAVSHRLSLLPHLAQGGRLSCHLEIVSRAAGQRGFAVLPRRWVVERTLGWLGRQRRLSKDYEELPESSATGVQIALRRLTLRRLAQKSAF